MNIPKTYKLYIGGKFPRTESGRYEDIKAADGAIAANICIASRKDFREAVLAARGAQSGWASSTAYLRGQILYRIAEMLEGRIDQFVAELMQLGEKKKAATDEVHGAIDLLVYYAGWTDKYQQLYSSVNPVATSHFNFSMVEPTGVVVTVAPETKPLLALLGSIIPAIASGNTAIALASSKNPLCAISLAEVLHTSDLPGGVVNILTGDRAELLPHFASHMDVNALIIHDANKIDSDLLADARIAAAENLKRVILRESINWTNDAGKNPQLIRDTLELKTTWHPVGL